MFKLKSYFCINKLKESKIRLLKPPEKKKSLEIKEGLECNSNKSIMQHLSDEV